MCTYLGRAASAPVRPKVAQQVAEDLADGLGGRANPSTRHTAGRRAGVLLAQTRACLAGALRVDTHEVLLISDGMETDAPVVSGRACTMPGGRLVISPIEHPAVLDSARIAADQLGAGLNLLEVDSAGRAELNSVDRAVAPTGRTDHLPVSLVSVMTANNEIGVVQDMAVLVGRVREVNDAGRPDGAGHVSVHSDVVATLGEVSVDFHDWGLDTMSLTGRKLGAPVGVGALVVHCDLGLTPATGGGCQGQGLHSGTRDVVAVRVLALVMRLAVAEREEREARLAVLRRRILEGAGTLADIHATSPEGADRVASTAHLWFEEVDIEALLMTLDLAGISTSVGSVCHAGVTQPSHVLLAVGFEKGPARSTLCYSLGRGTSPGGVKRLLATLLAALEGSRRVWKMTHRE